MAGPATSVPILIFTRSQPRSLLSMARSKSADRAFGLPDQERTGLTKSAYLSERAWRQLAGQHSKRASLLQRGHIVRYPLHLSCGRSGRRRNDCGKVADGNCRPQSCRSGRRETSRNLPDHSFGLDGGRTTDRKHLEGPTGKADIGRSVNFRWESEIS